MLLNRGKDSWFQISWVYGLKSYFLFIYKVHWLPSIRMHEYLPENFLNIHILGFMKEFLSKKETVYKMENLTHAPSEEWNLTERLISTKCLNTRKSILISWPMNIRQESLLTLKPMKLLLELSLGFSLPKFLLPINNTHLETSVTHW